MPDINLSTLNGQDLRSLLDSARARGQAALSYQILQEMAARREGHRGPEPRMVSVNLGDPLTARDDTLELEAEAATEVDEEAEDPLYLSAPRPEAPSPRSVWDDLPPVRPPKKKLQGLPRLGRPGFARAAVFGAGIVLGAAAGWGAASLDLGRQAPPPAAEPPADFVRTANAALPAPAVVQPTAPPAQIQVAEIPPPDEAAAAEATQPAPEAAAPKPPEQDPPHIAVAEAAPPPAPAPEPPKITVIHRDEPSAACAAQPTPADRAICADPQLRRLQRELRAAYGEALEAHEDRDTLRQRQLAWRDARNTVDDPAQLAGLYEARIRKLHAATEAARGR